MNRHRILTLAAAAATALLAAIPHAAQAQVTSITLSPATQNYTGSCPGTISFTATITGAPGQVTYQFFGNGGLAGEGIQTGTIPASGTLVVTDNATVDGSGQGSFQRQALAKQNNLVYSNHVSFSVTCTSVGPTPFPIFSFPPLHLGSPTPNHPKGLHSTNDAKECGRHNGSFACVGVTYDELVLVWDYNPARTVCITHIGGSPSPKCSSGDDLSVVDGYKIYRVDGGRRLLKSQPGQTITAADVGKTAAGDCYSVTSYHGSTESSPSNTFCVSGETPIGPSTTLHTVKWTYRYRYYYASGLPDYPQDICNESNEGPGPCIGWYHHDEGSGALGTLEHYNIFWRAYFRFDPNAIAGKNIGKATLLLHAISGDGSCVKYIAAADRDWWDNRDMVGGDFHFVTGAINSKYLSLDVTSIVRGWARGDANNGFVLRGLYEDNGASDNSQCQTQLDKNAVLRIEQ